MKREEKNQNTRRRIMDSALKEFAEKGYGASSVNNICSGEDFSKGIIYHYFSTKEALYLECVSECFSELTAFLRNVQMPVQKTARVQLLTYFNARMEFFQNNPMYRKIFCEAVFMPPRHLEPAIKERRTEFDTHNVRILDGILQRIKLRPEVTRDEIVSLFSWLQDYVNAKYQETGKREIDLKAHEEESRMALEILLYGAAARQEAEE